MTEFEAEIAVRNLPDAFALEACQTHAILKGKLISNIPVEYAEAPMRGHRKSS
jgi:hypothetical protein